jgi:hypothetical protein
VVSRGKIERDMPTPRTQHGDADELHLYATNEGDLYRDYTVPIQRALAKRKRSGTYAREAALALFQPMVDKAAERWNREFGGDPDARRVFSPAVRREVADEMADHFEREYALRPDDFSSARPQAPTKSEIERDVARVARGDAPATPARRGSYPDDLVAGDVVVRRDIRGRKKYRVSHTGRSGNFVQVYTREVGGGSGQIVTFDRSQLKTA